MQIQSNQQFILQPPNQQSQLQNSKPKLQNHQFVPSGILPPPPNLYQPRERDHSNSSFVSNGSYKRKRIFDNAPIIVTDLNKQKINNKQPFSDSTNNIININFSQTQKNPNHHNASFCSLNNQSQTETSFYTVIEKNTTLRQSSLSQRPSIKLVERPESVGPVQDQFKSVKGQSYSSFKSPQNQPGSITVINGNNSSNNLNKQTNGLIKIDRQLVQPVNQQFYLKPTGTINNQNQSSMQKQTSVQKFRENSLIQHNISQKLSFQNENKNFESQISDDNNSINNDQVQQIISEELSNFKLEMQKYMQQITKSVKTKVDENQQQQMQKSLNDLVNKPSFKLEQNQQLKTQQNIDYDELNNWQAIMQKQFIEKERELDQKVINIQTQQSMISKSVDNSAQYIQKLVKNSLQQKLQNLEDEISSLKEQDDNKVLIVDLKEIFSNVIADTTQKQKNQIQQLQDQVDNLLYNTGQNTNNYEQLKSIEKNFNNQLYNLDSQIATYEASYISELKTLNELYTKINILSQEQEQVVEKVQKQQVLMQETIKQVEESQTQNNNLYAFNKQLTDFKVYTKQLLTAPQLDPPQQEEIQKIDNNIKELINNLQEIDDNKKEKFKFLQQKIEQQKNEIFQKIQELENMEFKQQKNQIQDIEKSAIHKLQINNNQEIKSRNSQEYLDKKKYQNLIAPITHKEGEIIQKQSQSQTIANIQQQPQNILDKQKFLQNNSQNVSKQPQSQQNFQKINITQSTLAQLQKTQTQNQVVNILQKQQNQIVQQAKTTKPVVIEPKKQFDIKDFEDDITKKYQYQQVETKQQQSQSQINNNINSKQEIPKILSKNSINSQQSTINQQSNDQSTTLNFNIHDNNQSSQQEDKSSQNFTNSYKEESVNLSQTHSFQQNQQILEQPQLQQQFNKTLPINRNSVEIITSSTDRQLQNNQEEQQQQQKYLNQKQFQAQNKNILKQQQNQTIIEEQEEELEYTSPFIHQQMLESKQQQKMQKSIQSQQSTIQKQQQQSQQKSQILQTSQLDSFVNQSYDNNNQFQKQNISNNQIKNNKTENEVFYTMENEQNISNNLGYNNTSRYYQNQQQLSDLSNIQYYNNPVVNNITRNEEINNNDTTYNNNNTYLTCNNNKTEFYSCEQSQNFQQQQQNTENDSEFQTIKEKSDTQQTALQQTLKFQQKTSKTIQSDQKQQQNSEKFYTVQNKNTELDQILDQFDKDSQDEDNDDFDNCQNINIGENQNNQDNQKNNMKEIKEEFEGEDNDNDQIFFNEIDDINHDISNISNIPQNNKQNNFINNQQDIKQTPLKQSNNQQKQQSKQKQQHSDKYTPDKIYFSDYKAQQNFIEVQSEEKIQFQMTKDQNISTVEKQKKMFNNDSYNSSPVQNQQYQQQKAENKSQFQQFQINNENQQLNQEEFEDIPDSSFEDQVQQSESKQEFNQNIYQQYEDTIKEINKQSGIFECQIDEGGFIKDKDGYFIFDSQGCMLRIQQIYIESLISNKIIKLLN